MAVTSRSARIVDLKAERMGVNDRESLITGDMAFRDYGRTVVDFDERPDLQADFGGRDSCCYAIVGY